MDTSAVQGIDGWGSCPVALGNLLLFGLASVLLFWGLDSVLDRWLPDSLGWLRWLLLPLAAVALLLGGLFAFAVLANLLLGPFLGHLAAAVQTRLGRPPAANTLGFTA